MPDRSVDPDIKEVPEIDEVLTKVLQYVIVEAQERIEKDGDFAPFTAVAVKDTLILETLEGDVPDEFYSMARHTVQGVKGADAYGFCYDGYLDTDDGERDAIIAEGGVPGQLEGEAVCLVYEDKEDGTREYFKPIAYIGKAPNFMALAVDLPDDEDDEEDLEDEEEAPKE